MGGSRATKSKPIVVAGFEPLDVLQSIVMLLRQLNENAEESRKPVQARAFRGKETARR